MTTPAVPRRPKGPFRVRSAPRHLPRRMEAPRPVAAPQELRVVRHPLFGAIPLVPVERSLGDGRTLAGFTWDPAYRPPLPPGAVRGDIRRQLFCCETPRYFYVDLPRSCRACGAPFVFSAREQRHWYETLGFRLDATAVRCAPCRRAYRRERGTEKALSDASRALSRAPLHAAAVLAYARAAVTYAERFGHGPLDLALAQLRALRVAAPDEVASLFWEARCHEAAGRRAKAAATFERFLSASAHRRGFISLQREATARKAGGGSRRGEGVR